MSRWALVSLLVLCLLGFGASYAAAQAVPPPPPPDNPPPPPPDNPPPVIHTTPPPVVTHPTVVTHTPPATSAPSKPVKHKKPAPPPIVYTRTHGPRDIPVWVSPPKTTGSLSPQLFSISTDSNTSAVAVKLAAAGVLAVALLLLGLAAIPEWAIRPGRAHLVLAHWRVQIAASGLSALFAAAIVFLIGTSAL